MVVSRGRSPSPTFFCGLGRWLANHHPTAVPLHAAEVEAVVLLVHSLLDAKRGEDTVQPLACGQGIPTTIRDIDRAVLIALGDAVAVQVDAATIGAGVVNLLRAAHLPSLHNLLGHRSHRHST